MNTATDITEKNKKLLKTALILSFITIAYNVIEGGISVFFGLSDATLALLGFGIDSFVEVLSGLGIAHMVLRMQKNEVKSWDEFEKFALKITGISFYILTAGLILGSVVNIIQDIKPVTTIPGIVVSIISIISMYALMKYKLKIGNELKSDAVIADANCTKTCFNLSIILLASSLLYVIFKISYIDILGSLGIAYFAFKEGKESMEKSKSDTIKCECDDD
jgi:divalent metal cation (Fe/Co/Zn/Cd) transporter